MSHSKESTGGLVQLGCIHVAQPWKICAGIHKELSEKVSLFFSRYVEWDGRVGKCQRTAGKTLCPVFRSVTVQERLGKLNMLFRKIKSLNGLFVSIGRSRNSQTTKALVRSYCINCFIA